jgi:alkylation response protein AidB-like acyl-CoA dehydrogenase
MNFSLDDEHLLLRNSARSFFENEVDLAPLLRSPEATVADAGYMRTWPKMAELGWLGIVIPEDFGGAGMGPLELAMIVQEAGRALAPSPMLGALAAAWALVRAGSQVQKQRYLSRIAAGDLTAALAVANADGGYEGPGSDAQATAVGEGYRLQGAKSYVVDGASAGLLVVAAELDGKRALFAVDAAQPGVTARPLRWKDITRDVAHVAFHNAEAELLCADDTDVWPWVRDRILLVIAADSAGGLERVVEMSTEYAKERKAFGKPIGAFQANKHALADSFAASECASVGVLYAGWALGEETEDAGKAAAIAKAYSGDAYMTATAQNVQLFGAIGFMWEMKNHLYFKRARSNGELFGAPALHRSRVIDFAVRAAA